MRGRPVDFCFNANPVAQKLLTCMLGIISRSFVFQRFSLSINLENVNSSVHKTIHWGAFLIQPNQIESSHFKIYLNHVTTRVWRYVFLWEMHTEYKSVSISLRLLICCFFEFHQLGKLGLWRASTTCLQKTFTCEMVSRHGLRS